MAPQGCKTPSQEHSRLTSHWEGHIPLQNQTQQKTSIKSQHFRWVFSLGNNFPFLWQWEDSKGSGTLHMAPGPAPRHQHWDPAPQNWVPAPQNWTPSPIVDPAPQPWYPAPQHWDPTAQQGDSAPQNCISAPTIGMLHPNTGSQHYLGSRTGSLHLKIGSLHYLRPCTPALGPCPTTPEVPPKVPPAFPGSVTSQGNN